MASENAHLVTMPKWGLAMAQGRVVSRLIEEGANVTGGDPLVEIETEKVVGVLESPRSGVLRRQSVPSGEVAPVGGLLGVVATPSVSDEEIDRLVTEYQLAVHNSGHSQQAAAATVPASIDLNGGRICYLRQGDSAETAVLIHGFGGDLNTWALNHQALAAGHSVYAMDLPGHGCSSKSVGDGPLTDLAEVIKGFMKSIGVHKAHIVGHSLGGAVGFLFALKYPECCQSLVLIASAGLGPEIDTAYIRGFISATRRNDLRPQLEKLFAEPKSVTRQLVDGTLKYKRLDGVESALRTIASRYCPEGTQSVVLREETARLRVPMLALWGSEDKIIPSSHVLGLPDHIRTGIFTGCGHMVQMEAASKVNEAIRKFWKSHQQ